MPRSKLNRRDILRNGALGALAYPIASQPWWFGGTPQTATIPERYHRVVLRLDPDCLNLEPSLRYEGNNLDVRGERNSNGLFQDDGSTVARRWQQAAEGCAGVFVLRDSLWSQQDHVTRQRAFSPLLPPNWITAASLVATGSLAWQPVFSAPVDDDRAWNKLATPSDLFGSAPKSDSLFKAAIRPARTKDKQPDSTAVQARNARTTLKFLGSAMNELHSAGRSGDALAVARIGAEISCQSDCRYFTTHGRRRVIPITVTNPSLHEVGEGKGFIAPEHVDLHGASEIAKLVSKELLQRRLNDGDIAIERYDISRSSERSKAIQILEDLIPIHRKSAIESRIWLWVNGPLKQDRKLQGTDATRWVPEFQHEIQAASIDHGRLRLVSKPSVDLPKGPSRKDALDRAIIRFKQMDLPLSLNMRTDAFRQVLR